MLFLETILTVHANLDSQVQTFPHFQHFCQHFMGFCLIVLTLSNFSLSGKMCQININECASQPCLHGGTCVDQINAYLCNCTDEYMGRNCEYDFDACFFKPCKNGGECVTQPRRKEFYCECAPGTLSLKNYRWNFVEFPSCILTHSYFYSVGFSGLECNVDIDDCANITCPAGRECVDLVNDYKCVCPQGYSGDNCTLDVDYCASSPCKNNGTCQNIGGTFVCDCSAGFEGTAECMLCLLNLLQKYL